MRRRDVLAGGLAATLSPAAAHAQAAAKPPILVYIGTQGSDILAARFDPETGQVSPIGPVAAVERPTWLATDPDRPILYAVSELGNDGKATGSVLSFAIDPASGALREIGRVSSGGGGPTHLSYDRRAHGLFVANYGSGSTSVIPVGRDGTLAAATVTSVDTSGGAEAPHAHGALLDPGGRFVLTADKGADRIFIRRYDGAHGTLTPADPPFVAVTPRAGPRHLVFSPDGRMLYAVTEVAADVRVFRWNGATGRLTPVQTIPIDPPGSTPSPTAAEIAVSRDGRVVYASSRGGNAIAVFAVDRRTGTLAKLQDMVSPGLWPRSFAFDPSGRWMLVASQNFGTITVLAIDPATGRLTLAGTSAVLAQKPVALAFFAPA